MSEGKTVRFVYWQDGEWWLGYLEEFPDYWSQAENFEELQNNLAELYKDLTSGEIPCVQRIAELKVA